MTWHDQLQVLSAFASSSETARRRTLLVGRITPPDLAPIRRLKFAPVPVVEPDRYPWENLSFEGGGCKGYAYIGALATLEAEGIYPRQIRRVVGTSVGSLIAMVAAVGAPTDYILAKFPTDLKTFIMDAPGGRPGSVVNVVRTHGMHPGLRAYEYLGDILQETAGSADITFRQLHERFGRELCVPVTNITRMMTEYCHPKTTPHMPVRVAVRMSMSLPILLQPVLLAPTGDPSAELDAYVDGGLLCNNPIHAFDGWWLSMAPEDAFLHRLRPFDRVQEHYPRSSRFSPLNDQTLGFTLFAEDKPDISESWVRPGGEAPTRPNTQAARRVSAVEREHAERRNSRELRKLLDILDQFDRDDNGSISLPELQQALIEGGLEDNEIRDLLGTADPRALFRQMSLGESDQMEYQDLLDLLESRHLGVTAQLVGFPARPPRTAGDYAHNLLDAVSRELTRANHDPADRVRTVPINTDYVSTQSFGLVQADLDFLVESGRRATAAFLTEWEELNPSQTPS